MKDGERTDRDAIDNPVAAFRLYDVGLTSEQDQTDDGKILTMATTEKQRAIEALEALPEKATIEDAIERLCFIAKIEERLRQSETGQLVRHDGVKKQFLP